MIHLRSEHGISGFLLVLIVVRQSCPSAYLVKHHIIKTCKGIEV
jgi:hypothetical protein